jgi:hypothetical protein
MISLLYHSHTVVPAHLGELEALGLVEPGEQILVALDGVLLDGDGRRLSGPTLHDYCLITDLRVVLWARDYGRHLCYAFPLAELIALDGVGVDPLHATLQLTFVAPEERSEEQFTLTLLPLADLQAALTLLRAAAETAQLLLEQGVAAREAAPAILATLSAQIYGDVEGLRPGDTPYRWPDGGRLNGPISPAPVFQQDPASLPPGQIYAAGRLARSAWDTLRRSLKEAELPFDLNSGSLRELTDAVRAINELVHTVSSNPAAQQMAMAFIHRQGGRAGQPAPPQAVPEETSRQAAPIEPPATREYREIPLRRRDAPAPECPPVQAALPPNPMVAAPRAAAAPRDRRELPLRRRGAAVAAKPFVHLPKPLAVSGSGDADGEERSPGHEDHR